MRDALVALIIAVILLTIIGYAWVALILAFSGALVLLAAPPSKPVEKKEKKWQDVPVPDAGPYPDFNFWKEHVGNATEQFMKIMQAFGVHYAYDDLQGKLKETIWGKKGSDDQWFYTPWGTVKANKKMNPLYLHAMMDLATRLAKRAAEEPDPEKRKQILQELEDINKKIKDIMEGKYPPEEEEQDKKDNK